MHLSYPAFLHPEFFRAHCRKWLQTDGCWYCSLSWLSLGLRNSHLEGQNHWWLWHPCLLILQEILHFSECYNLMVLKQSCVELRTVVPRCYHEGQTGRQGDRLSFNYHRCAFVYVHIYVYVYMWYNIYMCIHLGCVCIWLLALTYEMYIIYMCILGWFSPGNNILMLSKHSLRPTALRLPTHCNRKQQLKKEQTTEGQRD